MTSLNKVCNWTVPAAQRFERSYIPVTESGCWIWIGSCDRGGYGKILVYGKQRIAHRYAYELYIGPIPDGFTLDHLCRVRPCVNPSHLEPVTMKINILRGEGLAAQNKRATHCKYGHEFTHDNTYLYPSGVGRSCKVCIIHWRLIYKEKRNGTIHH